MQCTLINRQLMEKEATLWILALSRTVKELFKKKKLNPESGLDRTQIEIVPKIHLPFEIQKNQSVSFWILCLQTDKPMMVKKRTSLVVINSIS